MGRKWGLVKIFLYGFFCLVVTVGLFWFDHTGIRWVDVFLHAADGLLSVHAAPASDPGISRPESSVQDGSSSHAGDFPSSDVSSPPEEPFTFVWISDTQLYSESYPDIFRSMTGWVADHAVTGNIRYLLHTGDVVNNRNSDGQWQNAAEAMALLSGKVPYLVAAGNHDVGAPDGDYSRFSPHFGQTIPENGGLWEDGKGQYAVFSQNGMDFLLLFLGYGNGQAGIDWANEILAQYPDHYAILGVHSYMHETGVLTTIGKGLYSQIVEPNANVRLVLCGHHHSAGQRVTPIDDDGDGSPDRTVYQLLADYQDAGEGGGGFMRLLTFDTAAGTLHVHTYSPWLDKTSFYEDPAIDTFDIPL